MVQRNYSLDWRSLAYSNWNYSALEFSNVWCQWLSSVPFVTLPSPKKLPTMYRMLGLLRDYVTTKWAVTS